MEDHISAIARCSLFDGISREDLYRIFSTIDYRTTKYNKNDIISPEGRRINQLSIILEGIVLARMTDSSGKVVSIEDLSAPRMIAPAFLYASNNHLPVELVAADRVSILSMPKGSLTFLLQDNEHILLNYLKMISDRARFLSEKIKFLTFPTIRGKLAFFFLKISREQNSDHLTLTQTQSSLARLFGVSRPALSRSLHELQQAGMIRVAGKKIDIIDKHSLKSLTLR